MHGIMMFSVHIQVEGSLRSPNSDNQSLYLQGTDCGNMPDYGREVEGHKKIR